MSKASVSCRVTQSLRAGALLRDMGRWKYREAIRVSHGGRDWVEGGGHCHVSDNPRPEGNSLAGRSPCRCDVGCGLQGWCSAVEASPQRVGGFPYDTQEGCPMKAFKISDDCKEKVYMGAQYEIFPTVTAIARVQQACCHAHSYLLESRRIVCSTAGHACCSLCTPSWGCCRWQ